MADAEHEVEAWLETLDANSGTTQQSLPTATIVPAQRREESVRRASEFLAQLAQRGKPVELRTGKVIGEGGMGVVREAEQVALGRTVAIKTIKPGRTDAAAASDLLREAWVTGALEHPNIVPVHHLEIDDDLRPLLILKRVDGVEWHVLCGDAAEVQRRFGATDLLAWNLGILHQVLNALRFAHSRRIIHRDLKPSNVMVGSFGEVYLLDWGIAVSLDEDPTGRFPHISETGSDMAGTPSYMAPEMLGQTGASMLSERTDVYLAGAVLFELITGHPPHRGANALAIITSVISSRPALPSDTPPELAAICARAMQPDPDDRYATVDALQQALTRYVEHRGSVRLAAGAHVQLAELVALATAAPPPPREDIYRRLAICRFAFHEALAVWRDNADARGGLSRACIAVAEYELACGEPQAAVTLLSDLPERPVLLATAEAAVAKQATRHQQLELQQRDMDPTVDTRTRRSIIAIALVFVGLPLLVGARESAGLVGHGSLTLSAAGLLLASWILWFWAVRRAMTTINRRVFMAVKLIFLAQLVLSIGAWSIGLPVATTLTLYLFMWGTLVGMFALHTDRWLGVSSAAYFLAFLSATRFPDARMYATVIANACLSLTLIVRWRPAAAMIERLTNEDKP